MTYFPDAGFSDSESSGANPQIPQTGRSPRLRGYILGGLLLGGIIGGSSAVALDQIEGITSRISPAAAEVTAFDTVADTAADTAIETATPAADDASRLAQTDPGRADDGAQVLTGQVLAGQVLADSDLGPTAAALINAMAPPAPAQAAPAPVQIPAQSINLTFGQGTTAAPRIRPDSAPGTVQAETSPTAPATATAPRIAPRIAPTASRTTVRTTVRPISNREEARFTVTMPWSTGVYR